MVSRGLVLMARTSPGSPASGKPLQIAVDSVSGTTEATQHPGGAEGWKECDRVVT